MHNLRRQNFAPFELFFEVPFSAGVAPGQVSLARFNFPWVKYGREGRERARAIAGFDCVCTCRFDVVNVYRKLKGAGASQASHEECGTLPSNNKARIVESERASLCVTLQFLPCARSSAL